jgi:iron complex transport system permease protein
VKQEAIGLSAVPRLHSQQDVRRRRQQIVAAVGGCLLVLSVLSLLIGRYPGIGLLTPRQFLTDDLAQRLVLYLRLPRVITAVLLGMVLSAAGLTFQTIFANPLVEPGFLGVSQGAAFGAACCIVFWGSSWWLVQGLSLVFALAGLGATYLLACRIRYGGWILRLVLAGIAVSAMFSAGLGMLKYLADPLRQLPEITFWLLGGLAAITWTRTLSILPLVGGGLAVLLVLRWRLNLLSLSDQVAFSLGSDVPRERFLLLVAAVVPTAAVISVAGIVGWVGLIVPHIVRRLVGADTYYAMPLALLLGGLFTLFCDTLARTVLVGEIPLGILTSLIGAASFLVLMTRPPTGPHR